MIVHVGIVDLELKTYTKLSNYASKWHDTCNDYLSYLNNLYKIKPKIIKEEKKEEVKV